MFYVWTFGIYDMVDDVSDILCMCLTDSDIGPISIGYTSSYYPETKCWMMLTQCMCGESSGSTFPMCPSDSDRWEVFGYLTQKLKVR